MKSLPIFLNDQMAIFNFAPVSGHRVRVTDPKEKVPVP